MKEIKNVDNDSIVVNKKTKNKFKLKNFSIFILFIVAVFGSYGSLHFYNKYKTLKTNPNVEDQKETVKLVGILSKLMELPKDEMPTVAKISDKEKLKGQAFFDKAENGDILFAYTNSMKAILYRPSTDRIINVAPITINQNQQQTQIQTQTPIQNPVQTKASEKSKTN